MFIICFPFAHDYIVDDVHFKTWHPWGAAIFPPLLIFHWEAGADILLDSGPVANATPFLHHTLARPDVFAGSAIASVPVTLKTAWEAFGVWGARMLMGVYAQDVGGLVCCAGIPIQYPYILAMLTEVLCGVAASSTSDFREQGSSLRLLEEQNLWCQSSNSLYMKEIVTYLFDLIWLILVVCTWMYDVVVFAPCTHLDPESPLSKSTLI